MFIFMFYLQNTEQIAAADFYLNIPEDDKLSQEFLPRMVNSEIEPKARQPTQSTSWWILKQKTKYWYSRVAASFFC